CWVHSVTWVLVPPPIAPTLPCATFRSPHTPAGFHFVIGCWQITGLPLLLPWARNLPWAPYRLLMLLPGSRVVSHGSLLRPPIAAARPVICPWAPVTAPYAAAGPVSVPKMGVPCNRTPIAGLSPSPHSAMCHFQVF
ncbi:unnamed protein product, partial [Staurois parvus]